MQPYLTLVRPGVSLAVALGSLCGMAFYVVQYKVMTLDPQAFLAPLGAFVLCSGCSALNQVQERKEDALMQRTAFRPLVTGLLSPARALTLASCLTLTGLALFFASGGWELLFAGIVVILSYNGLYTPLKTRTPLALLAGSIAGALPPVTGWLAAGGSPLDPPILTLFGVFYLWQVPHFWLLAEKHRQDYERAGFRLTSDILPPRSRDRLMALWVAAYFLGLALFLLPQPGLSLACLVLGCVATVAIFHAPANRAAKLVDLSLPLALIAALLISL